jgi:hypothetical protein
MYRLFAVLQDDLSTIQHMAKHALHKICLQISRCESELFLGPKQVFRILYSFHHAIHRFTRLKVTLSITRP